MHSKQAEGAADLSVATWQVPQVEAHQAYQPLHMVLSSTGSFSLQLPSGLASGGLGCCPAVKLSVAWFQHPIHAQA